VAEYNSIAYKYHIFLIHSLVVRHLGYFHNLANVNSAAVNMGMQVSMEKPELLLLADLHLAF
jgi:hypothetical protein